MPDLDDTVKTFISQPDKSHFTQVSISNIGESKFDKFLGRREELLWKLSLHPRETVRHWAEDSLTKGDVFPSYPRGDNEVKFLPWALEDKKFQFTLQRATLTVRALPVSLSLAHFLMKYKSEEIAQALISYLLTNNECYSHEKLTSGMAKLLRHLVLHQYPNTKDLIAKD